MVRVHVRYRAGFGREQAGGALQRGQQPVGGKARRAGEAAVEMRLRHLHPPEGEVAEVDVQLRLGVAGEEARLRRPVRVAAGSVILRRGAGDRQPGMGERVAGAGLGEQQRAAPVGVEVAGVGGLSCETRKIGDPSWSVATVTSEAKGSPDGVQRRQRGGSGLPEQPLGLGERPERRGREPGRCTRGRSSRPRSWLSPLPRGDGSIRALASRPFPIGDHPSSLPTCTGSRNQPRRRCRLFACNARERVFDGRGVQTTTTIGRRSGS